MEYKLYAKVYELVQGRNVAELSNDMSHIKNANSDSDVPVGCEYLCSDSIATLFPFLSVGLYEVVLKKSIFGGGVLVREHTVHHKNYYYSMPNTFGIKPGRYKIELKPIDMDSV